MLLQIALIALKIAPAFVNRFYSECISQNLAPVCLPVQIPTLPALVYHLTGSYQLVQFLF